MKNIKEKILIIAVVIGVFFISNFLHRKANLEYENNVPPAFYIFFLVVFQLIMLLLKKKARILILAFTVLIFILLQGLILMDSKINEFVYNLFTWNNL